jgi:peroxiredoxin
MLALACGVIACGAVAAAATYSLLGKEAPDFALRAVSGPNVRLSEYRGDVVVLSFWGSRCVPCATQLAALASSLKTYESAGLKILGVGVDDDAAHARDFANAQSVAFPLLLDPKKDVSRRYLVDNLPLTLLIDRGGTVRYVHRDYHAKGNELYLNELRELLNE